MSYNYTNGDGVAVLLASEPNGATEPVSIVDNAIRQIKAYLNDPTAGPAALIASLIPSGLVIPGGWASDTPPSGWLIANGAAVSRTTYSGIFAVHGTSFGGGDGSTTFNLPDLQERVAIGKGGALSIGDTGGEASHALTSAENGPHTHPITLTQVTDVDDVALSGPPFYMVARSEDPEAASGNLSGATAGSSGSGTAHNNLQPYLVLNGLVKI